MLAVALESTIAQLFLAGPCLYLELQVFRCSSVATQQAKLGGNGEIRTHGTFLFDSFQDCCNKPDSATFPLLSNTLMAFSIIDGALSLLPTLGIG